MQILYEILPENENTAAALGFFDGLHCGHRNVVRLAAAQKKNGLLPVCFTFSKSPKSIITGESGNMIMTESDKIKTLEELGIEQVIEADFESVRNISAEDFFSEILLKKLRIKKLFCGFNYHFGKNGEGDARLLQKLCSENSVELCVVPAERDNGKIVSSTLIRNMITDGDVRNANRLLCSQFGFCSVIEHGAQLGRTIGTPTINQQLCSGLVVPKFGVYASAVTLNDGSKFCGVTNIGIRPTVGGKHLVCETWMPEYSGAEIYGESADIRLIDFIRPEKKFASIDEMSRAIKSNGKTALEIFARQYYS